jgi:hypothetical protein
MLRALISSNRLLDLVEQSDPSQIRAFYVYEASFFSGDDLFERTNNLISQCTNLTDLALDVHRDISNPSMPDLRKFAHLRYLVLTRSSEWHLTEWLKQNHSNGELTFPRVTHFEMSFAHFGWLEETVIPHFPNLTHIMARAKLPDYLYVPEEQGRTITGILARGSLIQMFLVCFEKWPSQIAINRMWAPLNALISDPRFSTRCVQSWVNEWEDRIEGRETVWTRRNVVFQASSSF